jgi:hypothetical protein
MTTTAAVNILSQPNTHFTFGLAIGSNTFPAHLISEFDRRNFCIYSTDLEPTHPGQVAIHYQHFTEV